MRRSISQLHAQPHRSLRGGGGRAGQGALLRGCDPALPRAARRVCSKGGVHWGVALYADLIARFEKAQHRRRHASYDPSRLDVELFGRAVPEVRRRGCSSGATERFSRSTWPAGPRRAPIDDFAASGENGLARGHSRSLRAPNFYFGCEADDPMTATAFDARSHSVGRRHWARCSARTSATGTCRT